MGVSAAIDLELEVSAPLTLSPPRTPIAAARWVAPLDPAGRYRVLERLGQGGFGTVHAAFDRSLHRRVAVKLLKTSDPCGRDVARLLREARILAGFNHPNVVQVFDVGTTATDLPFIVMELVEGEDLHHFLSHRAASWEEILDVYLQAGRGLAGAHHLGLTHRDFKPSNVMVGRDGRVRVLDFGLAQSTRDEDEGGLVAGTPLYMAPELHRGRPPTRASDQFSFCVAVYSALYGVRPFRGRDRNTLERAKIEERIETAPTRTGVPRAIRSVLLRGLRAAPLERWPTMDRLLTALAHARRGTRARRVAVLVGFAALTALRTANAQPPTIPHPRATIEFTATAMDAPIPDHHERLEHSHAARAWLERQYTSAIATHRDEVAIDAAATLVHLLATELDDPDEARRWARHGRAHVTTATPAAARLTAAEAMLP